MGRLSRSAIALVTLALATLPVRASAQPAQVPTPAAIATRAALPTPSIDHVFYGRPALPAHAVATPAAATPAAAAPPARAKIGTAASEPSAATMPSPRPLPVVMASPATRVASLGANQRTAPPQRPSIDHVFYGRRAAGTGTAAAVPVPAAPVAAPTVVAAIIPPAPATPAAALPAAPAAAGVPTPAAAGTAGPPPEPPADGLHLYLNDPVSARRDPFNWSVTAIKSHHQIAVFYRGRLYQNYHAVFGRSRFAGPKQYEGDRRTPEGNYLIVSKHRSARFRWFLKINYPNAADQANFALMRSDGDIPRGLGEGGSVGIHGTDLPILNVGNIDWTTGCISIDNEDISQLARLLPIGTLVVIKP